MTYETIKASDRSGTFKAYIAMPEAAQNGDKCPAIIVIQEIFGVNKELRDKCDLWASKGYIAISPDLFWRQEPGVDITDQSEAEWEKAFALFNGFDVDKGVEDLIATDHYLKNLDVCNGKTGSIGYCLGGQLAYLMATRSETDVNVGYYGVNIQNLLEEAKNIKAPLMLHIAEQDEFVPEEARTQIIEHFKNSDLVETYSYDANHAFSRGNGVHYDEACAKRANERSYAFIDKALK